MTSFTYDLFKIYNSYHLHLKYPTNSAEQNWLDSCEILNRIYQGKSNILVPSGLKKYNTVSSTSKWIDYFCLEIEDDKIIVRTESRNLENSFVIGIFSLPWELPYSNLKSQERVIYEISNKYLPPKQPKIKLIIKN